MNQRQHAVVDTRDMAQRLQHLKAEHGVTNDDIDWNNPTTSVRELQWTHCRGEWGPGERIAVSMLGGDPTL